MWESQAPARDWIIHTDDLCMCLLPPQWVPQPAGFCLIPGREDTWKAFNFIPSRSRENFWTPAFFDRRRSCSSSDSGVVWNDIGHSLVLAHNPTGQLTTALLADRRAWLLLTCWGVSKQTQQQGRSEAETRPLEESSLTALCPESSTEFSTDLLEQREKKPQAGKGREERGWKKHLHHSCYQS